jgi:hypothetical protein
VAQRGVRLGSAASTSLRASSRKRPGGRPAGGRPTAPSRGRPLSARQAGPAGASSVPARDHSPVAWRPARDRGPFTYTSASSPRPPANSSATSSSTPPGTTQPRGLPPSPNAQDPNPDVGSDLCACPETSQGARGRIRTCATSLGTEHRQQGYAVPHTHRRVAPRQR